MYCVSVSELTIKTYLVKIFHHFLLWDFGHPIYFLESYHPHHLPDFLKLKIHITLLWMFNIMASIIYCIPFYFCVCFIFANCKFAIGFAKNSSKQYGRGKSAEDAEKRIWEIDPVDPNVNQNWDSRMIICINFGTACILQTFILMCFIIELPILTLWLQYIRKWQ